MSHQPKKTQLEKEKELVAIMLSDFDLEKSPANSYFKNYPKMSKVWLVTVAKVLSDLLHLDFPRESQRRRDLCLKWYDQHFSVIKPILDGMQIKEINSNEEPIFQGASQSIL